MWALLQVIVGWPLTTAACLYASYGLILCIYRLTLHPLARFPGPWLSAATFWSEFYHEVVRDGQYVFRIRDMHAKYGPIVRVTPDELHVNDPAFIPELMPVGKPRREKYKRLSQVFALSQATGVTVDHDLHRSRRGAMAKMFSKESIRRLEPIMRKSLDTLMVRLEEFRAKDAEIRLLPMFGAFTSDVITEYAYGFNSKWMAAPHFNEPFFKMLDGFHAFSALAVQFKWFLPLFFMLPRPTVRRINPGFESFVGFRKQLSSNIESVMKDHHEVKDRPTVFDEILESRLSDEDKKPLRLLQEAQNISVAGTMTTALILSHMTVYLLSTPRVLSRLRAELKEAIPDPAQPPSIRDIEQLPYLDAVVTEGLRLAMGTSRRQTRIAPSDVLTLQDNEKTWHIPPGSPVGMAAPLIHLSPTIFPNPLEFRPERFLEDPSLKRCLITFSQGSRQCLGMQMATIELLLVHSEIWRRFGSKDDHGEDGWWELFETDSSDVEFKRDRFLPYAKKGSRPLQIKIRRNMKKEGREMKNQEA
ncbi:hypothetical protein ACLMJK_000003 [Lecanora helva]